MPGTFHGINDSQFTDHNSEVLQERMIRQFRIDRITRDPRFTHMLTINFDRDIRWEITPPGSPLHPEPRSKLAAFLKRLHFNLQKIGERKSKRRIQQQDLSQYPDMCAVVEDHARDLGRTARHLHILVQCPLLHEREAKVRAATERAARSIFECGLTKTGFHVDRLPNAIEPRKRMVAYPFKQIAKKLDQFELDSMERVWDTSSFLESCS